MRVEDPLAIDGVAALGTGERELGAVQRRVPGDVVHQRHREVGVGVPEQAVDPLAHAFSTCARA